MKLTLKKFYPGNWSDQRKYKCRLMVMNILTKNQHYVPKCYLKAWCTSNKEQIHVYDKTQDKSRVNNINDVASERFFYDTDSPAILERFKYFTADRESKSALQPIENAFAKEIEPHFSNMLNSIIDKAMSASPWYLQNCFFISSQHKKAFSTFLALQFIRIKSIRNGIKESADVLQQVLRDMNVPEELQRSSQLTDEEVKNIHIGMLLDLEHLNEIITLFNSLTWFLGVNRTSIKFYTSDHPVCTKSHICDPIIPMNGLGSRGVEVFYPLSPNIMLVMVDGDYHKQAQPFERKYIEITEPENVDYWNSILAMQALRSIFSADGDFKLLEKMKSKEPDIFKQHQTELRWGGKTYYPIQ